MELFLKDISKITCFVCSKPYIFSLEPIIREDKGNVKNDSSAKELSKQEFNICEDIIYNEDYLIDIETQKITKNLYNKLIVLKHRTNDTDCLNTYRYRCCVYSDTISHIYFNDMHIYIDDITYRLDSLWSIKTTWSSDNWVNPLRDLCYSKIANLYILTDKKSTIYDEGVTNICIPDESILTKNFDSTDQFLNKVRTLITFK